MLYLIRKLKHYYNSQAFHIFIISFLVYAVINMIENYIHYNIGRNPDTEYHINFSSPSALEWKKIFFVMLVFASLQGILTILVDTYWTRK